jgi:hypothetical protein
LEVEAAGEVKLVLVFGAQVADERADAVADRAADDTEQGEHAVEAGKGENERA